MNDDETRKHDNNTEVTRLACTEAEAIDLVRDLEALLSDPLATEMVEPLDNAHGQEPTAVRPDELGRYLATGLYRHLGSLGRAGQA